MVHTREALASRNTWSKNPIHLSYRCCLSPIVYQTSDYIYREKELGIYALKGLNSHPPASRGRVGTRAF